MHLAAPNASTSAYLLLSDAWVASYRSKSAREEVPPQQDEATKRKRYGVGVTVGVPVTGEGVAVGVPPSLILKSSKVLRSTG